MKIRFFLPAILWMAFMCLVFYTPGNLNHKLFSIIPHRALAHFFLFAVFVYNTNGAFKKQWKYQKLRINSEFITLLIAAIWIIVGNAIEVSISPYGLNGWYLVSGAIGSLSGIGAFKLVYGTSD